jgi:hypothetical protein
MAGAVPVNTHEKLTSDNFFFQSKDLNGVKHSTNEFGHRKKINMQNFFWQNISVVWNSAGKKRLFLT